MIRATDEALMREFQNGAASAVRELVVRYQRPLFTFALRQLRVPSAAEDIVQETFVRVVQNATEFKHEAKFTTWLYTIARNLCIDQMRKNALRRHPSLDQSANDQSNAGGTGPTLGEQLAGNRNVEREVVATQLREVLELAVEKLPEDQREVFLLREVSNLPFKEIAEITGVSENTVKSRMRYALERLQTMLADYGDYARELI
jgi:RNA polymerase sigma-70 factor, ECF subfamily